MSGPSMGSHLKARLAEGTVVLPGVYNALTALLVEEAGYHGVYVSGAGLANGVAGLPDLGLLSREEVARQVEYITGAIRIPVVVDADTGYGGPLQVAQTVRVLERKGAAAVQIEDQTEPKRCGHLSGKSLIPREAMVAKIEAAVRARENPDLMIIARTDARGVEGFEASVARGRAYREAGADVIFPEALESEGEFEAYAAAVSGRLLANMTEFGRTPYLSVEDFRRAGYALVIFPMTLFRVMAKAAAEVLEEIRDKGSQEGFLQRMQTREALYRLIRYRQYAAWEGLGIEGERGDES